LFIATYPWDASVRLAIPFHGGDGGVPRFFTLQAIGWEAKIDKQWLLEDYG